MEPSARTRLREAALERFGRRGIHQTSTGEIIADAGLRNPSAITYSFGSKAKLVELVLNILTPPTSLTDEPLLDY